MIRDATHSVVDRLRVCYGMNGAQIGHAMILFRVNRIGIPSCMRRDTLKIIHQSHRGVVGIKARAREAVFWPGMSRHIDLMVRNCVICQQFQNAM